METSYVSNQGDIKEAAEVSSQAMDQCTAKLTLPVSLN